MVGSRCDNITDQRQLIADTHRTLTVKGGGEGQRDIQLAEERYELNRKIVQYSS